MRATLWIVALLCIGSAGRVEAQKVAKQDSIAVELGLSKDRAAEAVVAAFTSVGLPVTATSPGLVTADLGEVTSMGHGTNHMIVRAVVLPRDTGSVVIVRGEARGVNPATGTDRITNKQKGPYKKVWQKIEAAALALQKGK